MRRIVIVAFVAMLAFSGAACSKKSDNASSDTSSTTGKASGSSGGADTSTTKASAGGSGGKCPTQAEVDEINKKTDAASSAKSADVAAMKSAFNDAADAMAKYLPDNLKGDLETVKTAMDTYLSSLEGLDLSSPANLTPDQMQKLQDASKVLETPEVQQAQKNIQDYFKSSCPEIKFGGDTGTSSTTTG